MLPLTGGRESFGGSVQDADHRGRSQIQGATEGTGFLQGVQGDDGGGIPGDSPDDSAWEGGRDATEWENPGRRGRATDILDGIPIQGRPIELPG